MTLLPAFILSSSFSRVLRVHHSDKGTKKARHHTSRGYKTKMQMVHITDVERLMEYLDWERKINTLPMNTRVIKKKKAHAIFFRVILA